MAAADEAVVVTATRNPQPALEVPAAISRLYAEDLREARRQVDLSEALGRVPGIVVQNRHNYAQDLQISSRGFGARATFGVRGLRLLQDGIPASMPDGQGQAASFVPGAADRIEILRGPFSALYGNAAGGVVNVISAAAPERPELAADLWLGSFGAARAALRGGARTGALDAAFEVSGFRADGFRPQSRVERAQWNLRLGLMPSADTRVTLIANGLRQPDSGDPLGLTRAQFEQDPRQTDALAAAFGTRKSVGQEQVGLAVSQRLSPDARLEASGWLGARDMRQYLAFAGTGDVSSGGVVDLDRGFGGAGLRYFQDTTFIGRPLAFSLGGELEAMQERRRGYVNAGGVAGALRRDEDNLVVAAGWFAQAEWRFAERWRAHAGLRGSRVGFRTRDDYVTAANPDDSGRREYSATTPLAGLLFRLTPAISVYANSGRGFETPTFAELAYRNAGSGLNTALAASRSRHQEAGVKAVHGSTRLDLAVFRIDTEDEIAVDRSIGGRSTFRNAGRTTRAGMELSGEARLSSGLEANAALSLLEARFRDGFAAAGGEVAAGNTLPGVPGRQAWAQLVWRPPGEARFALEVLSRSRVAVNDRNAEFADGWTVVNLALSRRVRLGASTVTPFLRIDNLGDRRYAGSVIVNEANARHYEPAPGRHWTLGVQARLAFE